MSDTEKGTSSQQVNERRNGAGAAPPPPEQEQQAEAPPASGEPAMEDQEPMAAAGVDVAEFERVREELERSRRRVDELARAYQALERDREDFKQRLTRERERMIDVERGNVARLVLEAVDELDRCLQVSANDTSPLAQGVRMIRDNLVARLQSTGIERLQVVGQRFDPNSHEAADMEITTSEEEDQKVVAEVRAGYRLKDRVIRPAQVKVAKYVAPAQA